MLLLLPLILLLSLSLSLSLSLTLPPLMPLPVLLPLLLLMPPPSRELDIVVAKPAIRFFFSFYIFRFLLSQFQRLGRLLILIPKYRKSSMGFRSFECFNWSELLNNVIFAKTWPTKAKPFLGSENLTRLQISENYKTCPFDELYNHDRNQL